MKTFLNILRWLFGLLFCLSSIGGFLKGDTIRALMVLIVGLLLLPPVTRLIFKKLKDAPLGNHWSFSTFFGSAVKIAKQIDCSGNTDIISNIDTATKSYKTPLSSKEKKKLGKIVYLNALDFVISDLKITDDEKERLGKIKQYFSFTDNEIANFNSLRNQAAVQKLIAKKYDNKLLTDGDKKDIFEFATYLNLDARTVEAIRKNIASSIFKIELNSAISDRQLSPKEENYLKQLLTNLELGDDIEKIGLKKSSLNDLIFFKMFWQADNGYLLPVTNTQIALQKNEECYMGFPAELLEDKTVTTGYKHINHGFSIPITKGIRYRAGTGYSMPVRETTTTSYIGAIYLTDRRIIFVGGKGSFNINFANGKLLSFTPYKDGIDFIIDGWVYTIKIHPLPNNIFSVNQMVDLYCSGLTSCIRYNQNPDDPVYLNAVKEVKENEQLIKFDYA